jgi:hypothetical protein
MVSKKLRAAIDAFREEFSKYNTQAGALYQCCDATDEFIHFVHRYSPDLFAELGVRRFEFDIKDSTGIYPSVYKDGDNESGHSRAPWHCIVDTKNVLIDWTARQYVADAPFPLIIVKRYLHISKVGGDYYTAIRKTHIKAIRNRLAKAAAGNA